MWRFRKTFFGTTNYSRKTFLFCDYCSPPPERAYQVFISDHGRLYKRGATGGSAPPRTHRRGLIYNLLNNIKNCTISNELLFLVIPFFFLLITIFLISLKSGQAHKKVSKLACNEFQRALYNNLQHDFHKAVDGYNHYRFRPSISPGGSIVNFQEDIPLEQIMEEN